MTEQFPPAQPTGPSSEQPPSHAELNRRAREAKAAAKANKNWFARHKVLTGVGVIAAVGIAGSAIGGGGDETGTAAPAPAEVTVADINADEDVTTQAAGDGAAEDGAADESVADEGAADEGQVAEQPVENKATTDVADEGTVAQQNALESAESYLEYSSFSKNGLLDQLTSEYGEGYETVDAKWAIKHVDADWKAEAVESAQSYLEYDSFSRAGLIEQLSSEYGEQFTTEQAEYAADQVGL